MEWLTQLLQAFARPFQWWVVVAPWERGIRIRLGKRAHDLAPGIHFRIPFLDRVHVQSIRLRTILCTSQSFTTKDGHPVTVSFTIDYAIGDLRAMFNTLAAPDQTLMYRAAAAIGDFIGRGDLRDLVPEKLELAGTDGLSTFGCGLDQIRVRLTGLARARPLRIILHEYGQGAGLHHNFDQGGALNT